MNPLAVRLRLALLTGPRRSGMRGTAIAALRRSEGYEFAELREYESGDDPRRIDWAASARAGALQTRVMIEERSIVLAAAIDASGSMFVGKTRSNYENGCDVGALWYAMATVEDRCARLRAHAPLFPRNLPGEAAAHVCAETREPIGSAFEATLATAPAILPRDSHLLIVSDFFDVERLTPVLRLCAARFDAIALLAADPWGGALPLGGFVRLRDAESGRIERIFVGKHERARYAEAVERRERAALDALHACGLRAGRLSSGSPGEALFDVLHAPGRRVA